MISTLRLEPRIRKGELLAEGAFKTQRTFLDFIISGRSLLDAVADCEAVKPGVLDRMSVLATDTVFITSSREAVLRLLLQAPGDFPNNRRALFICPECGDLGCGAISAVIEKVDATFVWREFGYENNWEDGVQRDEYNALGPFVFSCEAYENALREAHGRLP